MGSYLINNVLYTEDEIVDYANEVLHGDKEKWEKDIWRSIVDWFDDKDHIIFQTSGTTGIPKDISHSKASIRKSARITRDYFSLTEDSAVLLCLPANYVAGRMMIYRSLICEWHLHYIKPASLINLPNNIVFDFAAMVPMQIHNSIKFNSSSLAQVNNILIGGAAISTQLEKTIKRQPSAYFESYGSTETLTHVAIRRLNKEYEFHGLGEVHFDTDKKERLIISAPHISKDPIQTNDLVKLNSSRSFNYVGRFDDIINSGGIKINPLEIEDKISSIINSDFYIGKKRDDLLGEKMVLFIKAPESGHIDKTALSRKIEGKLNKFERPKEIIVVKEINRTFSGKIKRNELVGKVKK